jgi:hypothetical protein
LLGTVSMFLVTDSFNNFLPTVPVRVGHSFLPTVPVRVGLWLNIFFNTPLKTMSGFVISTEGRDLFVLVGYATQDFSLRSK